MRLKEPFVRKHIHAWDLVRKEPVSSGVHVERKCRDCDLIQHGLVRTYDIVPDSVLQLAEALWYEGPLTDARDRDTDPFIRF